MAKVVKLSIENFRKFKSFTCNFGQTNLVCLIGRGDSGKTSILDALAYVLSPSWSLSFTDYDFCNQDTSGPIRIRAVVTEFPDELAKIEKYGLFRAGYNAKTLEECPIDEAGAEEALAIELTVDASLEPKWEVENPLTGERKQITARDRALLNMYSVADYLNKHFAWAVGSPLSSVTRASGEHLSQAMIVGLNRRLKDITKEVSFDDLAGVLKDVQDKAVEFGSNTDTLSPAFDMKQFSMREGAVCLHDQNNLPVRLHGKGAKRLLSVAIQSVAAGASSITLIDEVEQGLEPDRVRTLVHILMKREQGQVFLTTHSDNALLEVGAKNVFWIRDEGQPVLMPSEFQNLLRANPQAFFGRRVLLCEGQTEYGFCRALEDFHVSRGGRPFSHCGTVIVVGGGSQFVQYADMYLRLGVELMVFCDSDEDTANEKKERIAGLGATVVSWRDGESFEQGIFSEVTPMAVHQLLTLAASEYDAETEADARQGIRQKLTALDPSLNEVDIFNGSNYSEGVRAIMGRVAKGKKKGGGAWYKRVSSGIAVGKIVCDEYNALPEDGLLKKNIDTICQWATNV